MYFGTVQIPLNPSSYFSKLMYHNANVQQVVSQIVEIATNTRRRVTISGYFKGFTMYMYRSIVIARSEATEANSKEFGNGRVKLQNKTGSLSMSNMISINSTIHVGYKVKHMRKSASAKFPTKYDVSVFSLLQNFDVRERIMTAIFSQTPINIATNLKAIENKRASLEAIMIFV